MGYWLLAMGYALLAISLSLLTSVPLSRCPALHRPCDVGMNEADRHRPFAYGGGHPFGRAAPHVARGEDAGQAGLQQEGGSSRPLPPVRVRHLGRKGPSGQTNPFLSRSTQPSSQVVFGSAPMKR